MAIDTKAKRFSVLSWANGPALRVPLFEQDGAVDADDRAQLLGLYGGNAWADLAPVEALTLPVTIRNLLSLAATVRNLQSLPATVRNLLSLGVER